MGLFSKKKFVHNQKVKVVSGFYTGKTGTVVYKESGFFHDRYNVYFGQAALSERVIIENDLDEDVSLFNLDEKTNQ